MRSKIVWTPQREPAKRGRNGSGGVRRTRSIANESDGRRPELDAERYLGKKRCALERARFSSGFVAMHGFVEATKTLAKIAETTMSARVRLQLDLTFARLPEVRTPS